MKKLKIALLIVVGLISVLIVSFLAIIYIPTPAFEPLVYEPITPDYWPTNGFKSTTPEEQGMDSAHLLEMLEYYAKEHAADPTISIDSITIIRNGYLVADIYMNPLYPEDTPHAIHSCTKSIMSALIGIAIEQGHIENVDVPVVDFFKHRNIQISDERMNQVTLADLLSMQSGIRSQDSFLYKWRGLFATMETEDWVPYILSMPIDLEPGKRFDYSNLSSFLLSAIIHESTGMDTLSYARKNLFNPLGIREVRWETSPRGIHLGFARMWLKPHDMAKFGLLYLQKGKWEGRQIIPEDWIHESLSPHAYPKNYVEVLDANGEKDDEATQMNWISANFFRPFSDGYGYQWWLDRSGTYNALGTSGQYIMVLPEQNLVVAVSSSSSGLGTFFPAKLLENFILPAIESDASLDANDTAYTELQARSAQPILVQEQKEPSELPPIATQISSKIYSLAPNRWSYDNFQLISGRDLNVAEFNFTAGMNNAASIKVGLDGRYRFSGSAMGSFAARGDWIAPDTFEIMFQQIGYSAPARFILKFKDDQILVEEHSLTGKITYAGKVQ